MFAGLPGEWEYRSALGAYKSQFWLALAVAILATEMVNKQTWSIATMYLAAFYQSRAVRGATG